MATQGKHKRGSFQEGANFDPAIVDLGASIEPSELLHLEPCAPGLYHSQVSPYTSVASPVPEDLCKLCGP